MAEVSSIIQDIGFNGVYDFFAKKIPMIKKIDRGVLKEILVGGMSEPQECQEKLQEEGLSPEEAEMLRNVMNSEELKKGIENLIRYFEDSFDILHDSVMAVDYQIHSDKLVEAIDHKERFEKRLGEQDNVGDILLLRNDIEKSLSALKSDIKVRVEVCESIPVKGKKIFGFREVKEIRKKLDELKEALLVYKETTLLLVRVETYLGKFESAYKSINTVRRYIYETFHLDHPLENRMYTLTEDPFWIDKPKECCATFDKAAKYLDALQPEFLLVGGKEK